MPPQYAVVAYVTNAIGVFVEDLRRELYPEHAHLPAHLTVLPPRRLITSEAQALETLQELCRNVGPFEVTMGAVTSFMPVTPTVFLQVEHGAYRMRELHDRLIASQFQPDEPWPYMPHLTIVKMDSFDKARLAQEVALERWSRYHGTQRILVEQLTFVREGENSRWIDIAPIRLGRTLTQPSVR